MTDNYVQRARGLLAAMLPDCDSDLLGLYALLAFTTGINTTLENVHDAWAIWRSRTNQDHPSLKPFRDLAPSIQVLDRKYAEAIREVARTL